MIRVKFARSRVDALMRRLHHRHDESFLRRMAERGRLSESDDGAADLMRHCDIVATGDESWRFKHRA
jgi:hypothetical protein